MLDFEAGFLGAEEQCDDVDVFVRAGADRAFRRRVHLRRIVQQAEDRVAEVHLVAEPVFGQFKVQGDGFQEFGAEGIERIEKRARCAVEVRHFGNGRRVLHRVAVRRARRQRAAGVPEFFQVGLGLTLGVLGAEGGVAALASAWRVMIFFLGLAGQGEESLRGGEIVVDGFLGNRVAGDHGKAGLAERAAEGRGEGGLVGMPERIGDRFEILGHDGILPEAGAAR